MQRRFRVEGGHEDRRQPRLSVLRTPSQSREGFGVHLCRHRGRRAGSRSRRLMLSSTSVDSCAVRSLQELDIKRPFLIQALRRKA
ncbi:hypothetical protein EJ069_31960 [Mesorhizobium sp. M2A.F.Ca.ET.043.05.1.1]|nr:hypothetical protein EJ069_31960 [Mesorhizobium sp. M2A.F.Ca.ET.043.05.1.1]